MNDDFIIRIDSQTFADESFRVEDPRGLVVLAALPHLPELRWHRELIRICGPELKWNKVRHRWRDLSHDLRRAVTRDLRDALITIIDPSRYRFGLEKLIEDAVRQPRTGWTPQFRDWAKAQIDQYEKHSILIDSPATRIQDFLEDDGISIGDVGGIEGNLDESRSLLSDLAETLGSTHTVRIFGARLASAFSHLLDRDELNRAVAELWDMRYVSRERMFAHLLAAGERTQRVFDEGNQPSVKAIAGVKDSVRKRLAGSGLIVLTDDPAAGVLEQSSTDTPMLQVADLAGGYARTLYLDLGLKAVCEEFKGVILNGSMVRDWSQIERANLSELRVKR